MSLDFFKTEYMVPKGTVINDMAPKDGEIQRRICRSFGIVVNDMVPKVIVDLINFHLCFVIVVNDMVPKNTM